MKDKEEFYQTLTDIDGKDFTEYSRLIGDYDFTRFVIRISQVPQTAADDRIVLVLRVAQSIAGFPPATFSTPIRRTGLEDLLARKMSDYLDRMTRFNEDGVAYRRIDVPRPGQKILPRSLLVVSEDYVEVRLQVRFPIRRGRVASEGCIDVFFSDLPELVNHALLYCNLEPAEVDAFVGLMEDADQIRTSLPTRGLVAFAAEGALIRRQGGSDLPDYDFDRPLEIDPSLMTDMEVPNAGTVRGMGISNGITLILGDDTSGRNDFMRALGAGVYNHVPGDGREYVVTMPDAVYVAADRGRSVQQVDVSAFLQSPDVHPQAYTSNHADACSAQAASTVEAMEIGARTLLFDEQDSYPGFLAQDSRLLTIVGQKSWTSVPIAQWARKMSDELGISLIVAGNAGIAEFIPVADTILCIQDYRITDVTEKAKQAGVDLAPVPAESDHLLSLTERSRWLIPSSIDASAGRDDCVIRTTAARHLLFGKHHLDMDQVVQIGDDSQVGTIGLILEYGRQHYLDEPRPIRELLDLIDRDLSTQGLGCLSTEVHHDLARPRRYEIAAVLNRLPSLRVARIEG